MHLCKENMPWCTQVHVKMYICRKHCQQGADQNLPGETEECPRQESEARTGIW